MVGDAEFAIELLDSAVMDFKKIWGNILKARKAKDLKDLEFIFHKARGLALICQCSPLANLSTELERFARHAEISRIEKIFSTYEQLYHDTLASMALTLSAQTKKHFKQSA